MASGLAWLSLYAQANALLSTCSATRRRPTSEVLFRTSIGSSANELCKKNLILRKRRKRSPFSNGSKEVMVEVLIRLVQPGSKSCHRSLELSMKEGGQTWREERELIQLFFHLQMLVTPGVRIGKYGANVFYGVFSFLCYSPMEKFPLIKLQVMLGFDFVAPVSLLVPPKPSRNVHIAAFYVYKDEARDKRMKICFHRRRRR
ncbi:hypothetical protein M9H77_12011 [Catharanthus roseus]|uniref:Uncharacterized protein n=1 Tax=Catharanthus roseus TaxID=4058 RepID=A0ACC0BG83_CATRO|nr:hypothetical protein M9H77_12011 [Catharanthus roseus]